jgi:alpha-1,2-mannosyltransferase
VSSWLAYAVHLLASALAVWCVLQRRRGAAKPWLRILEIAIAGSAAVALLSLTSGPVLIDFVKSYYHGGRAVMTDPATLYDCSRAQCFVNMPIVAVLFVPFAPFDPYVAGVLFSIAAGAALVPAVRRLAREGPANIIVWLIVLNGPLYYSVRIGNTTHVLLIVLIVAFERIARNRQVLPGVLLAGAALMKPPLALFLPYLALRGRIMTAGVMAGCAAAAVLLSVALFGFELHRFWFREFVLEHGSQPPAAYNVQSVSGFLAHLMTRGHLRDWYPVDTGPLFRIFRATLEFAVIAAVAVTCWRAGRPRTDAAWQAELSLVLLAALLIAPISWTHYFVLLVIPIAALVSGRMPLPSRWRMPLALSVLLISPPVVVLALQGRIANALYERVLVSHYFFGGVVLLGVLIASRAAISSGRRQP